MKNRNINECALVDRVEIMRDKCSYTVSFACSEALRRYFKSLSVRFEYPIEISAIPDAVLLVPFVANIAPLIWLTDAKIVVPCLDRDFAECLDKVKAGYREMYPDVSFKGEICVEKIVGCSTRGGGLRCAMFYSGGLDSVDTFVRHRAETPDLISVWGADIKYDNAEGWKLVHSAVEYSAKRFQLEDYQIHSQFREFLDEGALTRHFEPILHDSWWHGIQHGLGLLGHVAPLAYVRGYAKMYIASTFTDYTITCASSPLTDNNVCFCSCQVIHDGFDCTRQHKVSNIVNYCCQNKTQFPLHVCWKTQTGRNCCVCEKCLRTIAGLLAEGGNPEVYGFEGYRQGFVAKEKIVFLRGELHDDKDVGNHAMFWTQIHNGLIGRTISEDGEVGKFLRWVQKTDFFSSYASSLPWRMRFGRSNWLPIRALRKLYRIGRRVGMN